MTAPTTQLLRMPQFSSEVTVDSALLQWAHNELNSESKKRRHQFTEQLEQELPPPPPKKSPRKNDYRAHEIDTSKMSKTDLLLAYKRIWNNLDITNPTDAKLEPFVWHKIREYQKK